MSYATWLLKGLVSRPRRRKKDDDDKPSRGRRLLLLLLAILLIPACVGATSQFASLGVLPSQVSASGVSLVEANYSQWQPAYNVEIDFERLATAVEIDEENPNASWFGQTQIAEQGSQPGDSSQGGSGDAGAPSQAATAEAQVSASNTLQASNTVAASATSRPPTRRPSNTPVPPTLTPTPVPTDTPVPPPPPTNTSAPPPPPPATNTPIPSNTPTSTATNTPTNTATNTPTDTPTNTPSACNILANRLPDPCPECIRFRIRNAAATDVTITGLAVTWSGSPSDLIEVALPSPPTVWNGPAASPASVTFSPNYVLPPTGNQDLDLRWSAAPLPTSVDVMFTTNQGSCSISG